VKRSLFDKIWDAHVVEELPGGSALIFVDLIVAHEITSPQGIIAIEKNYGDKLYDPNKIVALIDHVAPAKDTATAIQAQTVRSWAKRQGIRFHDIGNNGICHVLVPERGYVTPGMVVACGDSHTGTLGAFGAFALGVGSTTQAGAMLAGVLILARPKVMKIEVTGTLHLGTTAKDLVLTIIKTIGFKGGTGYALEFTGSAIRALDMEGRMTVCNMSIEAGATSGVIAADDVTAAWLAATETKPGECAPIDGAIPADADAQSLAYMGLAVGARLNEIAIDQAFIGSCTNSRITDLRAAAEVLRGQRVSVPTIITPGSQLVKRQAEREGLHDVFQDAGCLWTHSSCGPCLGMSVGVIAPGTRVVSSTNRNFPGRMGDGGRVHLASPAVVAASAILGRIAAPGDVPAPREAVPV
jgi:3-isopropylmalate/(R)-2-methylmalate dehydratase large subunit